MKRLTYFEDGKIKSIDEDKILEKLSLYEDFQQAIEEEYEKIISDMDKLRSQGKIKSVTFAQLLSQKLSVSQLLSRLQLCGL